VQNGNAYEEGLTPAWQAFRNLWSDRTEATVAPVLDSMATVSIPHCFNQSAKAYKSAVKQLKLSTHSVFRSLGTLTQWV
jgi:hypothetical protein